MFRDKVILGSLVGIFGNIVMDIPQYPLWKILFIKHPLAHYAGSLFLTFQPLHHTFYGSVYSFLADYIYSAFLGILFLYFLELTGKHHYILKGSIFGAFLWFFSFGVLRSFPIVKLQEVLNVDIFVYLGLHILFGLGMGWFLLKWENKVERKTN